MVNTPNTINIKINVEDAGVLDQLRLQSEPSVVYTAAEVRERAEYIARLQAVVEAAQAVNDDAGEVAYGHVGEPMRTYATVRPELVLALRSALADVGADIRAKERRVRTELVRFSEADK